SESEILALSLRMCPSIDRSYMLDESTPPPEFEHGTVWRWEGLPGDWGYPMSLDGHIFRTAELCPLIARLDFHNPNTLETELARAEPPPMPKLICLSDAPVFNVPANLVQTTLRNRNAGGSAARLNRRFLNGDRL